MTPPVGESVAWGIVLAAGRGTRFGSRKQFAEVAGVTLADRVVRKMRSVCDGIVAVVPAGVDWTGEHVEAVATGGETRSASVRAGLAAVPALAAVVVVHDAAHPLTPDHLFTAVVAAVEAGADAAAPALALAEPLKRIGAGGVVLGTVPRADTVVLQTPHAFRAEVLRAVHVNAPEAVEDTELVGAHGGRVVVVPGALVNLHVTAPEHLAVVERLLVE